MRSGFFVWPSGKPTFDLIETAREHHAPLFNPGATHFEVAPQVGGRTTNAVEFGSTVPQCFCREQLGPARRSESLPGKFEILIGFGPRQFGYSTLHREIHVGLPQLAQTRF